MEDKLTIRVPQIWNFNASTINYVDNASLDGVLGSALGGASALTYNLTQFMAGAPVVDYSSLSYHSGGGSGFLVHSIDTSRPHTSATGNSFSSATPYSEFTDGLMQNRGATDKSTATDTFAIGVTPGGYIVLHNTLGNSAQYTIPPHGSPLATDAANTSFTATDFINPVDFYDLNGNYCVTIKIDGTPAASTNVIFSFDVVNPTYTDALNWGDLNVDTTRHTPTPGGSFNSHLYFDTGRVQGNDPSDSVGLYDMQGISFQTDQATTRTYPVRKLAHGTNDARGGFVRPDLYSTSTNGLYTTFSAGAATGGSAFAPADRGADYFTIFRGPGYVRMLGQVADPTTGEPYTDGTDADKDVSYFFGMFRPYEDVTVYKNPMAFLGDVGWDQQSGADPSDSHRPWWRTSTGALDDAATNIWAEDALGGGATGYWYLAAPFILSRDFVLSDLSTGNTPNEAKAFLPGLAQYVGRFWTQGSTTEQVVNGTKDDSKRFVVTPFSGAAKSTAWDHVVGWESAQTHLGEYSESPSAPRIMPIALRQVSDDDHGWTENYSNREQTAYTTNVLQRDDEWYENIGEIPGMYWVSERKRYDGATPALYVAGTTLALDGRNYRMVIGHEASPRTNATTDLAPVVGKTGQNTGNLLFDMDEI